MNNHSGQQNQRLIEENKKLNKMLEEMIDYNNHLIGVIQEQGFSERFQERIVELQEQNQSLKQQVGALNSRVLSLQSKTSSRQVEEMSDIIKNLMEHSNDTENAYSREITNLKISLEDERSVWSESIKNIESKYHSKIIEYEQIIQNLKQKNQNMNSSMQQRLKRSQLDIEERKNLKVSMTIEDLRHILERQIEEKDRVIRIYENLAKKMKQKLREKF